MMSILIEPKKLPSPWFRRRRFTRYYPKNRRRLFQKLGINAIWMTPIVEQIHGATDEGTGKTYGFHGY